MLYLMKRFDSGLDREEMTSCTFDKLPGNVYKCVTAHVMVGGMCIIILCV